MPLSDSPLLLITSCLASRARVIYDSGRISLRSFKFHLIAWTGFTTQRSNYVILPKTSACIKLGCTSHVPDLTSKSHTARGVRVKSACSDKDYVQKARESPSGRRLDTKASSRTLSELQASAWPAHRERNARTPNPSSPIAAWSHTDAPPKADRINTSQGNCKL